MLNGVCYEKPSNRQTTIKQCLGNNEDDEMCGRTVLKEGTEVCGGK